VPVARPIRNRVEVAVNNWKQPSLKASVKMQTIAKGL